MLFQEWQNELKLWKDTTKSQLFSKNPIFLADVDSTNNYVKEHANLSHGTFVIAYQQKKGKGQKNRHWISNPGGLYLSIKLDLKFFSNFQPFWITATVAIGLCQALQELGLKPTIKWPNDILIQDKKVAGILTETIISNDNIITIIGLGCNISNSLEEICSVFPEVKSNITSLNQEIIQQKSNILSLLLEKILIFVEKIFTESFYDQISEIKEIWNNLCQISGKKIKIERIDSKEIIFGEVLNVTDSGSLKILKNNGLLEEFVSGDIKFVK